MPDSLVSFSLSATFEIYLLIRSVRPRLVFWDFKVIVERGVWLQVEGSFRSVIWISSSSSEFSRDISLLCLRKAKEGTSLGGSVVSYMTLTFNGFNLFLFLRPPLELILLRWLKNLATTAQGARHRVSPLVSMIEIKTPPLWSMATLQLTLQPPILLY